MCLGTDIYRKPTTTETTINFLSNHPIEHKMAALRFHISRMYSLPLDSEKKCETIKTITKNNNFPQNLLQKQTGKYIKNRLYTNWRKRQKISTTFTYHRSKIRKITTLFKNTNIGIAFRTTTTLRQLINSITWIQTPEHEKSGIYKLTCNTCQRSYIGQTSHNLKSRFQEHTRYIKNNEPHSAYALHILNCRHECGSINDTMTLLKYINTPSALLPYEEMYIPPQ